MKMLLLISILFFLTGCQEGTPSADKMQAQATAQSVAEAHRSVGMPNIVNYNQKRQVKDLYELLDREGLTTFSYIVDMNGRFHLLCESIGYGIPASVQFSNPQVTHRSYGHGGFETLPQAEPNGLFMPEGLSATYVKCVSDGAERVVYVELPVIVSPYRLQ